MKIKGVSNFLLGILLSFVVVVFFGSFFQILTALLFSLDFEYSLNPFHLFFNVVSQSSTIANYIVYFAPTVFFILFVEGAKYFLRKSPLGNIRFILIINILTLNIYMLIYFFYIAFGIILNSNKTNDIVNFLNSINASITGKIIFVLALILLFVQFTRKTMLEISKYIQK